jgi:4-hydroxy-3-methylbut-2-enyl diphosphate reductase
MAIIVSKKAGFCFGVKKALEETLSKRYEGKDNLCTLGPLIHNPQVLEILKKLGIESKKIEELKKGDKVIIRAHGVTPEVLEELKKIGCEVINCTCPRVAKIQGKAKKARTEGKRVILVGDKEHAETKGILGYGGKDSICISSAEEAKGLNFKGKAVLLAQSTFSEEKYKEIAKILKEKNSELEVVETICDATSARQEEAKEMAKKVEAVVVVGGSFSANTRRLKEIIEQEGIPAYLVEDETNLPEELKKYKKIGITAGASTPNWLINRVVEKLIEIRAKGFWKILWKGLAFLTRSNLLIFFSALSLIYIISNILNLEIPFFSYLIAPMFLFAFHTLNSFSEKRAQEINEPAQQIFIEKNKKWLKILSGVFLFLSILLSFYFSIYLGLFTFFASVLGLLYLFPSPLTQLPCSKDIFTSSAWAIFSTIFYFLLSKNFDLTSSILFIFFFFFIFLCRAIVYDLKDLQGDRMVGKETIPIYFGLKNSILFFKISLFLSFLLFFIIYLLNPSKKTIFLLFFPLYCLFYFSLFQRKVIPGGVRFSLYVDGFYPILALFFTFI